MLRRIEEVYKQRTSNIGIILGTAVSINDISDEEWAEINKYDTLGINNWFYHPTFIPKWLSLELKHYDWQITKDRLAEKWEKGWKNVGYIVSSDRAQYIADAIDHPKDAKVYVYNYTRRGEHPKVKKGRIDADFDPDGPLTKCYDASLTTLIHFMYKMGYEYVILYGVDWTHSYYFWSSGDKKYGKTHCKTNKDHEGKDPKTPHNTEHVINFIIDFNERHMKPEGREILVGYKKTRLYPALNHIDLVKGEIHHNGG